MKNKTKIQKQNAHTFYCSLSSKNLNYFTKKCQVRKRRSVIPFSVTCENIIKNIFTLSVNIATTTEVKKKLNQHNRI